MPRCVHPYRQGVTHDRSRKLKWPLFCTLSRTKSQILPPILHKNKENFALQNTPFFTKSRTIFQNYPICTKARTWFFAAFFITNQPNWYFWSQIVDSHYQSKKEPNLMENRRKTRKISQKILNFYRRKSLWVLKKIPYFFYFADTVLQNTLFLKFRGH